MTIDETILLVEDDASMREAIERLLSAAGYLCFAFPSAEALLQDSSSESAVCVVSDLRLPAMSGLDLLDSLRSRGRGVPFILITAHDAPGMCEEAINRGAAAYLAKPFLGTTLLTTLRTVSRRTT
ncbi:MAG: response regulator [Thermoanaerobaculia bacterium]|jgi:FixJ family two-component response regulator